ncbi:MAG: trigger factor [Verrucomicrobia bacterium]|nr:trigger factor [Verrucomicrobiota bacterium]
MNVTVNDTGPCKKLVRIELTDAEVNGVFAEVEKDFGKHAVLPGFRKGKAPLAFVLKSFEKEIKEEVRRKLVGDFYRKAVQEQKLAVYSVQDVEDQELQSVQKGQGTHFVATVEIHPTFELPNYRGLVAKRESRSVSEGDIDHAIDLLRGRNAKFEKVDREAKPGDFAVVNYTGAVEGRPISELAPASRGLAGQQNFWVEIKEGAFIPGFATQLIGAKAGDQRTVTVEFPADFVSQPLAGKKGSYAVEVVEVKERVLPAIDDQFAQSWEAKDVPGLREGVRQDLQNELNDKQRRTIREQVVRGLLAQVNFEMPESAVLNETRSVVYDIVRENQERGISKEAIDKSKDEIFNAANLAAKERVKAAFVFAKIAEKEGIKVLPQEFQARLFVMAQAAQMPPDKFFKELEKRNAVSHVTELVLNDKVIDFLQQNAKIEDIPAAPAAA